MTLRRRDLLGTTLATGAALAAGAAAAPAAAAPAAARPPRRGRTAGGPRPPVVVPNGTTLPHRVVDGVKVFHLVAEPITHEITPGLVIDTWGYNGRTPGPLIEVDQGDRCRFYVTNRLPEATTVHWHGVLLPAGMDGVAGLTQEPIPPGRTFRYEFTFGDAGTFMYHPHFDEMTQIALGMMGMIVVHPQVRDRRVVRDYALMAHEWKIEAGARRPDPLAMSDFNVLAFNGKAYPATAPLLAEVGDVVRIRLANLGPMDHHSIHVHGTRFEVVETDGGPVPPGARWPETTVLVPVGSVRVVELEATLPGDWPLHCHMTHHVMTQMGHAVPNLTGADVRDFDRRMNRAVPGYMSMGQAGMGAMHAMELPANSVAMRPAPGPFSPIEMGGMFTLLKVRDRFDGDADPGWYQHPAGTVSVEATADELARDGVTP